ncbi:MAG: hypothetical protein ACRDHG_04855, partial [Anaerolineales bacterium]
GEPEDFVVFGGEIALPEEVTGTVIAGLAYEGMWKSTKLAYAARMGTALFRRKKITGLGLLLHKTHQRGVQFGQDFDTMNYLPLMIEETDVRFDHMHESLDFDVVAVPGSWSTDARLCLKFQAPCPATVLALAVEVETHG